VTAYRDMGYLPEAVVNYLVRLGWSHGDQEIFTLGELIKHFGFDHVGATASVFNPEKMVWVNQTWLKSLTPAELARRAVPYFRAAGLEVAQDPRLPEIARAFQERAKTLVDLVAQSRYFFAPVEMDLKAREKFLVADAAPVLQGIRDGIAGMASPDAAGLEKLFHDVAAERSLGLGKVAQPVRVALTGGTASPGIYEVVLLLGREETLRRLDDAIRSVRS
jgi:glutamyl-tRNA synthetase